MTGSTETSGKTTSFWVVVVVVAEVVSARSRTVKSSSVKEGVVFLSISEVSSSGSPLAVETPRSSPSSASDGGDVSSDGGARDVFSSIASASTDDSISSSTSSVGSGVVILIRFGSMETERSSSTSPLEESEALSPRFSVGRRFSPLSNSSISASVELETASVVAEVSTSSGVIVIPTSGARFKKVLGAVVVVVVGVVVIAVALVMASGVVFGSRVIATSTSPASEVIESLVVLSVGSTVNMSGIVIPRPLVDREGGLFSPAPSCSSSKSTANSSGGSLVLKGLDVAKGSSTRGSIVLLGKTINGVVDPS